MKPVMMLREGASYHVFSGALAAGEPRAHVSRSAPTTRRAAFALGFVRGVRGVRHVDDLTAMFREYLRVVKPGGTVLVLEITRPRSRVRFVLAKLYLSHLVPLVAGLFSRGNHARTLMKYYWDTIEQCVPPKTILNAMKAAGFESPECRCRWGLFSEYVGRRPGRE